MLESDARRVLLVLASSTGGVGQHVRALAAGLVQAGESVVVCGPAATEELFGFTAVGAQFTPAEIPASPHPVRDVVAVAAVRRAARGARVVHAHGLRAGLVSALAVRGTPLVVTWHNAVLAGGAKGRVLAALERVVARSAQLTLCASEDLVDRVLFLGGRDARMAPVAAPLLPPPARDAADVRAELGADGRPLVLAVARLHPQKALDVLVDAAGRWAAREPQPLVAVAGSGPAERDLRAQIERTGAPVRLLGHRDDVADLLAACDVAVVTSRWEARQLFAQEALRAGRPLVTTAVGGLPGLVGDGAVLVPAGDVDAVTAAVERVLDDPAHAADLAARGRARAAGWPTQQDTLDQVRAVYTELVGP
ncbi:MAG TPA: glycosyltransferase family 4 protein [Mycobacteriales bacterium]|nr:glycosyltransferase family 4 protein [Mycobacteriales bacterium]